MLHIQYTPYFDDLTVPTFDPCGSMWHLPPAFLEMSYFFPRYFSMWLTCSGKDLEAARAQERDQRLQDFNRMGGARSN